MWRGRGPGPGPLRAACSGLCACPAPPPSGGRGPSRDERAGHGTSERDVGNKCRCCTISSRTRRAGARREHSPRASGWQRGRRHGKAHRGPPASRGDRPQAEGEAATGARRWGLLCGLGQRPRCRAGRPRVPSLRDVNTQWVPATEHCATAKVCHCNHLCDTRPAAGTDRPATPGTCCPGNARHRVAVTCRCPTIHLASAQE